MSFRNRLTLFFVLIVLVPMMSLAAVLFGLISDNEVGKADANLLARQDVATNLYRQALADANNAIDAQLAQFQRLAAALRDGGVADARVRARALARGEPFERIVLVRDGEAVVKVGASEAIAPARVNLSERDGTPIEGQVQVSVLRADEFSRRVSRLTDAQVVVRAGGRVLGASSSLEEEEVNDQALSEVGDFVDMEIDGTNYRAVTINAPGFEGRRVKISLLRPKQRTRADVQEARLLAGAILLGFFALAFVFALAVSRSLAQQVAGLLEGARRLGRGDFSTRVPTTGRDELAALGEEFNKMSDQLEQRLADLRHERERVQSSVRRLGQAVGSNLDRNALLKIVLTSALEGVDAQAGRVTIRPSRRVPMEEAVRVGSLRGLEGVVREAEAQVLGGAGIGEVTRDGASALAHPLREGDEEDRRVSGAVSVARSGDPFTTTDRELFQYLASQASVSIENVGLHETVRRESVTDKVTGLNNRRHFDEVMEREVERARRFDGQLGLVMFDIDDFKAVNDTHGHPFGDTVLQEVARVVLERSREIDEPARYGGEEFSVVLPGTDLAGAERLAERIREGIEELALAKPDGHGSLHVTASFGVASLPETSEGLESLVADADAALLEAKRAGKNRTVRAESVTDELTGLGNRRRYDGVTRECVAEQLGLVMLDVDDFEAVNDKHGQHVGDRVLVEIAEVVRERSREIDEPVRYEEDKFAVVCPETTLEDAYELAEQIREKLEKLAVPLPDGHGPLHVTASFGVASLPETSEGHEGLVADADGALLEAKRAGKNRTVRAKLGS